ncbi:M20/M25/M40 family metallo-hydrolase [Exiguobacterium artemiae]
MSCRHVRGRYCCRSSEKIGFSGHLDTVPVKISEWTKDPFGGVIEDGRIYGRGASDMKFGVMAMVNMMIEVNYSPLICFAN